MFLERKNTDYMQNNKNLKNTELTTTKLLG